MNNFTGIGRVGGDPTVRQTNDGKPVATFSVAIDSGYGQKKVTNWFKVVLFDKRAAVAEYIQKGHLIGLSGELTLSKWTDKAGVEQSSLELSNPDVTLIGRTVKEGRDEVVNVHAARQTRHAPPVTQSHDQDPFGDDVPF